MEIAVGTERGMWQQRQSDAHVAESIAPNISLFAVADGFGECGKHASAAPLALATMRDYLRRRQRVGSFARSLTPSGLRAILLAALDYANARLFSQSGSHDDFVGSGTSLTAVMVAGHHAFVGHVGDGRAYLLRLGHLDVLTADDAMFAGTTVTHAKPALPARPNARRLLWRSLGSQAKLEASIAHVELLAGDQLALCTDGVHRCVDDDELRDSLAESASAAEVVTRVLSTAKARGNADNGTLIVARDLLAASSAELVARGRRLGARSLVVALLLALSVVSVGAYVLRSGFTGHSASYSSSETP